MSDFPLAVYYRERAKRLREIAGSTGAQSAREELEMLAQPLVVGLYHLVIAAVYGIKRIWKSGKNRVCFSTAQHMNREYAKSCGVTPGNMRHIKIMTG